MGCGKGAPFAARRAPACCWVVFGPRCTARVAAVALLPGVPAVPFVALSAHLPRKVGNCRLSTHRKASLAELRSSDKWPVCLLNFLLTSHHFLLVSKRGGGDGESSFQRSTLPRALAPLTLVVTRHRCERRWRNRPQSPLATGWGRGSAPDSFSCPKS